MAEKPRIVILDGHTLNPGDLSWDALRELGDVAIYDRSRGQEIAARLEGARIVLTNKAPLTRELFSQAPALKFIAVTATGFNVVDVVAAKEQGIVVSNVPDYGTQSVAQTVFALLLELAQRAGHHTQTVREGRWAKSPDFCYWDFPLIELAGLTLGIVGYGRIGHAVAKIGEAFGMKILVARHRPDLQSKYELADTDDVFRRSDVLSLHCPLTAATKGMVNKDRLNLMKRSAFLINTSRGPLIDEAALANALNSDRIAGAAVDVLSVEPPPENHPLYTAKNCFITPHYAWGTIAARQRLMNITVENVRAFLDGKPINRVN